MSESPTSRLPGHHGSAEGSIRLSALPGNLVSQWRQWQAQRDKSWQLRLAGSEALRAIAARDRHLPARCQAPYISHAFDLETRYAILDAHYRFLHERLPARLRNRLLDGCDARIVPLAPGRGELTYLHMRPPMLRRCGELGLYLLTEDKRVLSSCTLTFAGAHGVLIGALHGSWAYMGRQPIRAFTRSAHGLRPKNLLLSLVYALKQFFRLGPIRAVADDARPAGADKDWRGAGQDPFWLENGGVLDADGCYLLPAQERRRLPEQVPSKRRAARRRREAVRADACERMLQALRYALPSTATPADEPESESESIHDAPSQP